MKSLDDLLEALKESETLKTFKQLETQILTNEQYKRTYDDLLKKQQRMVQAQEKNAANKAALQREYHHALNALKDSPIIEQYLHLQEDLNEDLQMLFSMIENALNTDIDK